MIGDNKKGVIFNIQKFSLHDGPGTRSIVFFKGCPMSCLWCSNPESQKVKPQIMYNKSLCISCKQCENICERDAIKIGRNKIIDDSKCNSCLKCAENCLTEALEVVGKTVTVSDVIEELKKDSIHYRRSGGGITLSGGETLLQPDFAIELLKECKSYGWHTAIETAMYVDSTAVKKVIPYIDLVMVDIKHMDSKIHEKFTGVPNEKILQNIKIADNIAKEMIIRVPVIEGFNSSEENIKAIAEFAKELKTVKQIDLLPYHNYGENKYEAIGEEYALKGLKSPTEEKMNCYKEIVENIGLICTI